MKKMINYVLFFIWYIVLLILGDTYLNFYIYAVGVVILLSIYLNYRRQTTDRFSSTLFLLFLSTLFFSTISSVNLPISLQKMAFYLLSVLVFLIFSGIKQISYLKMMRGLQFIGLSLCFLSLLMIIISDWGYSIPGFNILVSSYGHNHLSIFLLAITPFSWYQALFDQKGDRKKANWELMFPIIFSLMTLFSFGRTAVFLGLAQLFAIFLFLKKKFKDKVSKKISNWFVLLVVLFFIIFCSKISLGILLSEPFSIDCPFPKYQLQLCKPLDKEARPHYWKHSLLAIKDSGLFGSGPGTYQFVIKKYLLSPAHTTAHAHNAWLEVFVELGIIGGSIFLLVIGYLFIYSIFIVKKTHPLIKEVFLKSILLGIITLLINASSDFDLNFIGIFVLLLLFFAMIIGSEKIESGKNILVVEKKISARSNKNSLLLRSLIIYGSSIFIIGYALLSGAVELLRLKNPKLAFDFFPYISWHSLMFAEDFKNDEEYLDRLVSIHKNNPVVISYLLTFENDLDKQMEYKTIAAAIDPWSVRDLSLFEYYFERDELNKAFEELNRLDQLNLTLADPGSWLRNNYFYADTYMRLADSFFQDKNYKMAGKSVAIAQQKNNWIIDKHPIILGNNNAQMSHEMYDFFYELKDVPGEYYGYHRVAYAQLYSSLIIELMKDHHFEDSAKVIGRLPELADWLVDEYLSATINYFNTEKNLEDQLFLLNAIYQVKDNLSDETSELFSLTAKKLSDSATIKGDKNSASRFQEFQKNFTTSN